MTADFTMKANDLAPSIQAALTSNNSAVDLTNATVKFIMRPADTNFVPSAGSAKVNATGVVVNASGGIVRYDWVTGDTATPGNYVAEWQVTINAKPETFPTLTYHSITIVADLDGGV
jgi:hypothetical protein